MAEMLPLLPLPEGVLSDVPLFVSVACGEQHASEQREKKFEAHTHALEAKVRKQARLIARLQVQAGMVPAAHIAVEGTSTGAGGGEAA